MSIQYYKSIIGEKYRVLQRKYSYILFVEKKATDKSERLHWEYVTSYATAKSLSENLEKLGVCTDS